MQRRHRLRKSAEFQRVRALKQSWAHPLLVLYVAPNSLDVSRVGISVGKRIGKAVVRNRVKRLIREAVRSYLPRLARGYDLVIIARPPVAEASYKQVSQAVERLLGRARLLPREKGSRRWPSGDAGAAGVEPGPAGDRNTETNRDEEDSVGPD